MHAETVKWAWGCWPCCRARKRCADLSGQTGRIIVPYQAGQGTDVVARYFAEQLSRTLGQRF